MRWSGWRALADTVVIYVGALVTAQVVGAIWVLGGDTGEVPLAVLVIATPVALLGVAAVWLRSRYGTDAVRVMGRSAWRWSDVGVGVGVGLACFVLQRIALVALVALLAGLGAEVPTVQDSFRVVAQNPSTAPALVLSAVLLAPFSEELLFRGVLFAGIRARTGFWGAALVSAGTFTLAHLGDGGGPLADLIIVAGILPLGIAFAAVMERRGSLLACAVAHAVYNAGGVALLIQTAI